MTLDELLQCFPQPVIGLDRERRVVLWNRAAENLFGWRAEDVIGKPNPAVPDEVAAEYRVMCEAAFRGDYALRRESHRVTRDGTPLEVVVTSCGDGELALMFVADVTERYAAEERLAERESELRLLLDQLPAVLSTFDHDLVFTSAQGSGLRALGAEPRTFVGQALPEIIGDDAPPVASVRAEPLRRRDGTISGAINIGFDVTERRRAEQALRQLSAAMNKLQENERRRIARELHDELGQLLTSLRIDLGLMRRELRRVPTTALEERIDTMFDLVDLTISTVRRVARELRPAVLDEFGLRAALEQETAAFSERTGIEVKISIRHDELIDSDRATALYRIVQESLTNVARHSGATRVEVRVDACAGRVEAELRDNGRGITEEEANNASTLGLLGVRERAYALGGQAVIESIPGHGTRVFVSLPQ